MCTWRVQAHLVDVLVGADQLDGEFAQRRRLGVAEDSRNAVLLELVVAVRVGDGRAGRDVNRLVRASARVRAAYTPVVPTVRVAADRMLLLVVQVRAGSRR